MRRLYSSPEIVVITRRAHAFDEYLRYRRFTVDRCWQAQIIFYTRRSQNGGRFLKKSKSSRTSQRVARVFLFYFSELLAPMTWGLLLFWFSLSFKSGPRLTLREIRSDGRWSRRKDKNKYFPPCHRSVTFS